MFLFSSRKNPSPSSSLSSSKSPPSSRKFPEKTKKNKKSQKCSKIKKMTFESVTIQQSDLEWAASEGLLPLEKEGITKLFEQLKVHATSPPPELKQNMAPQKPGCPPSLLLPPESVTLETIEGKSHYKITEIPPSHSPLLIFINRKSGGQQGIKLIEKLGKLVNPLQIFDLTDGGPAPGLEMFKNVQNAKCLVCGGDGTVGWFLMTVDKMGLKNPPPAAILPLGTGNDLSRALGWGPGYQGEKLQHILEEIEEANCVELDRWNITIRDQDNEESKSENNEENKTENNEEAKYVMQNYFSVGVDAKISLIFHKEREAHPEKFKSRWGNKFFYGNIGGKAIFQDNINLAKEATLICDGKEVAIPKGCASIIVLNIDSYAGGTNPWGNSKKFKPQLFDDGMLEIVSIRDATELGLLKVGRRGKRLAQCSKVEIALRKEIPAQVDGEPWMQKPAKITITHLNRAKMLAKVQKHLFDHFRKHQSHKEDH